MSKLVGSLVVLLVLTMNVTAQIQKSSHNRVYVDEDYEYTETLRRKRGTNEQLLKGLRFHEAGDYRKAADAFDAAAKLDPSVFEAQYNLGIAYVNLGDFKNATNALQKAVRANSSSAKTWHFEKALSIDPKSASARFNLAMTCLALNQRDCAREQYAILKHVEPNLSTKLFDHMYSSKVLNLVK